MAWSKTFIKPTKKPIAEINVVPYIDVMLVLLVILMATAPLLTQGVDVDLPQAQAESIPPSEQQPLIVSVNSQGQYFLNVATEPEDPISPQNLLTRVAAELQLAKREGVSRIVLVKGDKQVDYGRVVEAMVLLQQAGANQVGLMTQAVEQQRDLTMKYSG